MAVTLIMTSCGPAEEEEVVPEVVEEGPEMILNVWGESVEKPQYGGTLVIAEVFNFGSACDPYYGGSTWTYCYVLECLRSSDYSLPREVDDFRSQYVADASLRGHIAESWETPNPLTIIFHIRQGVRWQDKPPMNGRELDAYDIEFTWQRNLGLGSPESGLTEVSPNPSYTSRGLPAVESVTATDKWTVVVKLSEYDASTLRGISAHHAYTVPPEVVTQNDGRIPDWTYLVGTGPFEWTGFVEGTSYKFTKSPNYWWDDERFPPGSGLQLPYVAEIRVLIMPEMHTQIAALRTGKLSMVRDIQVDQLEQLQKTDPELVQASTYGHPYAISLKVDEPPFSDIRVRKAMQMAINLEEIGATYFKGRAATTPMGALGPNNTDIIVPFDEWPEEVKYGYVYNPDGARQLLTEAGYPNGFQTVYDIPSDHVVIPVAQICREYWKAIGVDVELNVLEGGSYSDRMYGHTYEGMTGSEVRARNDDPLFLLARFQTGHSEQITFSSDPVYNSLMDQASDTVDLEERTQLLRQLEALYVEKQWTLYLPILPAFILHQPWLHEYHGEKGKYSPVGTGDGQTYFSYVWIDQALKSAMGH